MTDVGRSPRRDPSKRNSITDRILGSINKARQDTTASLQRRASSTNRSSGISLGRSASNNRGSPTSRIREWLDTCNREHDHHCSPSSSAEDQDVTSFRPVWLIDTVDKCIVRAKSSDRYVALSYVWGTGSGNGKGRGPSNGARRGSEDEPEGDPGVLVKANLDIYEDALPEDDLPRTVVDAMWLAKRLGLRHLWMDKLCIVQDDREEVDAHVRNMAYIFSNAYLTVVAAHGDVKAGLVALDPRRAPQGGANNANPEDLVRRSKWNQRGWTLEEALYSRRRVYVFEDSISWECHCESWNGSPSSVLKSLRGGRKEGAGGGCSAPSAPSTAIFAYRHSPWPDLDEYARIASDYSARRVALVDDTLRAFSGITQVLSQIYPGGFLYGMPLMFLDVALLWRPQASMRRRAVVQPPFLPSWSWMGWWFDGVPVDLTLWRAAADYVAESGKQGANSGRFRSPHALKIKPTLTWTLTDRVARAPVPNNGFQFRDLRSRRSSAAQYPPGWERQGQHFKHDTDDNTLFKYPVPVEDPPEDGEYPNPPGETAFPGPYLSFRTESALFEVDYDALLSPRDAGADREAELTPPVAVGNIWTRTNRWAGTLRAHDAWLGIQSSNYSGEESLEFIAISSGTERRGSHLFTPEQFAANKDAHDFIDVVNVLWIERIGGVAFRRGLGHILRKAWEAQPKEEVDVLLG